MFFFSLKNTLSFWSSLLAKTPSFPIPTERVEVQKACELLNGVGA